VLPSAAFAATAENVEDVREVRVCLSCDSVRALEPGAYVERRVSNIRACVDRRVSNSQITTEQLQMLQGLY